MGRYGEILGDTGRYNSHKDQQAHTIYVGLWVHTCTYRYIFLSPLLIECHQICAYIGRYWEIWGDTSRHSSSRFASHTWIYEDTRSGFVRCSIRLFLLRPLHSALVDHLQTSEKPRSSLSSPPIPPLCLAQSRAALRSIVPFCSQPHVVFFSRIHWCTCLSPRST